jgi:hypothetical protein
MQEIDMGGACSIAGEMRKIQNILIRRFVGNKSLARPRSRWESGV